jgi:DNA modification methylase
MHVEMWPIESITPYDKNPRINDPAVDAVAASIKEFGFRQPIVVDEQKVIIVGHTRYKAALKLGLKMVPVHVAVGLSPAQAKAYRIADNQTATLSQFDDNLLPLELLGLQEMGFDLNLTGFSADELLRLLQSESTDGLVDPDDIPEPPDAATTKPGDLWVLGKHRLLCADSGNPDDVDRLLDGAKIHLANCDCPYNVKVESRSNNSIAAGMSSFAKAGKRKTATHHQGLDLARHPEKSKKTHSKMRAKDRSLINDFVSDEEFNRLLHAWFGNIARVLEPGRSYFIWAGYANLGNYPPVLKECGLYFSQAIVWNKLHPVLTRKDFMGCFELAFYGWKEGAAHRFYGPNNALDLWEVKKVNPQNMLHLTQKAQELATRAIEYSTLPGENVFDGFGGSGWTCIAAEETGRRSFSLEIDPLYCDVIVQRWENFTGKKAVLDRSGAQSA